MRKRVWYNSIDNLERGIVNLTISLVENIESLTLLEVLMNILSKIKELSKGDMPPPGMGGMGGMPGFGGQCPPAE